MSSPSSASYLPRSPLRPFETAHCASCGQEFTRLSHFTYIRGEKVCRDEDACIERAIVEPDRELIELQRRHFTELAYVWEQLAGTGAGGLS
jgi:hypothetical protein